MNIYNCAGYKGKIILRLYAFVRLIPLMRIKYLQQIFQFILYIADIKHIKTGGMIHVFF